MTQISLHRLLPVIITILVSILLTACSDAPKTPLRIGSGPWPGYEPLYLARDLGYLDEEKVTIFELPSSDITMESFRNHSTDVATITLDETITLLHDGTKVRILLVLDVSHGGDAVLASPDIKQLSDIKGKRISIVNIPLGLYMLNRLLDKAGVDRKDVTVFPMPETKQEKFYRDGKADVVITFEPVKTKLRQAGAHVIFDSSMIPNEIFDLMVVHEDVYISRKEELCSVVGEWFKTLHYMETHRNDAAMRITHRLGLIDNDYDALLDGIILPDSKTNQEMLGGNSPGLLKPAKRLAKIMLDEKQISKLVDV
ncbi:MAG: ABC transporter substrate-binding protein, partial [Gammaproteobacteria bacterium]|nr:ABC transporter substrate-binding protein [Gammaproteobacteria bacterium]